MWEARAVVVDKALGDPDISMATKQDLKKERRELTLNLQMYHRHLKQYEVCASYIVQSVLSYQINCTPGRCSVLGLTLVWWTSKIILATA